METQYTLSDVAGLFSLTAVIARKAPAGLSPTERRLHKTLLVGAATLGGPLLEVTDEEELDSRLDQIVEGTELYRFQWLIAKSLAGVSLSVDDAALAGFATEMRGIVGDGLLPALAKVARLSQHLLAILTSKVPPTVLARSAEQQLQRPLAFLEDPRIATPVVGILLNYLKADPCLLALLQALHLRRALPTWLAAALVERALLGTRDYLRFLASIPELAVSEDVVPLAERLDLAAMHAESAESEFGYQLAALVAADGDKTAFPLFVSREQDAE